MPKLQFSDLRSVDAISNNSFEIVIPNMPAGGGAEKTLTTNCKGFTMPGFTISRLEVIIQGFKTYNSAGNVVFPGTFSVTFQEDSSYTITTAIRAWMQVCAGTESGTVAGDKNSYARDILLRQYNPRGELAAEVTMVGAFPEAIGDNPLESTQTPTAMEVPVTFSFDICELGGVASR